MNDLKKSKTYWTCQVAGWGVYAVINLLLGFVFGQVSGMAVASVGVLSGAGLALSHAYRAFVQRRGWVRLSLGRLVPRVLAASLMLSLTLNVLMRMVYRLPFWGEAASSYGAGITLVFVFNLSIIFLLWSLLYFGLHYFWNYKAAEIARWQLEAVARAAELKALRSQVNPHFLFNSLNSIRALIAEDPARAQEVVTQLSGLLRYALQAGEAATVALEVEFDAVRTYLALEATRLEERLRYDVALDEALRTLPVPPMLVQTLVENGIKHGIALLPGGGALRVAARRDGAAAVLTVVNTGRLRPQDPRGTGLGLQNATHRLHLLCGEAATLTLTQTTPDTVTAEVRMPVARAWETGNPGNWETGKLR